MKNIALIFPGQGAQRVGMGRDFYDQSPAARAIFDSAQTIVGSDFLQVIFEGPEDRLTSTAYCQPAILTASMAMLKAFQAHPKYKNISVKATAGLSLGEYSALAAAGVMTFEDALRLVQKRAQFMEEATKLAQGKMAAVIGFEEGKLNQICQQTGAQVANFNSPEQIVITGDAAHVEEACRLIKDAGAKNVLPLDVSGAFHSTLMQPAGEKFAAALEVVAIHQTSINVISNVNAQPHKDVALIRKNLTLQITSSVQWVKSIQYLASQGITDFIEIGPGKVLRGLLRRINPILTCQNIEKLEDLEKLAWHFF